MIQSISPSTTPERIVHSVCIVLEYLAVPMYSSSSSPSGVTARAQDHCFNRVYVLQLVYNSISNQFTTNGIHVNTDLKQTIVLTIVHMKNRVMFSVSIEQHSRILPKLCTVCLTPCNQLAIISGWGQHLSVHV